MNFDPRAYLADLGFGPLAPVPMTNELKRAWHRLCEKHHPDKGGDVKQFHKVTHAYKMLTDPEYRHDELIAEMKRSSHNAANDLNIRLQVPMTFEDAFFGRKIVISYNRLHLDPEFVPIIQELLDVVTHPVHVPAGSLGGYEAALGGGGHKCGDTYGHAIVVFMPLPHPKFRAEGEDIISQEKMPLEHLLKGAKIEVQTMFGLKTLRIPPGTKPGERLRIHGAGVGKRGSHIVIVDPVFPSKDELKKESWRGLGIDWGIDASDEQDPMDKAMNDVFMRIRNTTAADRGRIIFTVD